VRKRPGEGDFSRRFAGQVVSERLGHASATITLTVYQHVHPGMGPASSRPLRRAARRLRPDVDREVSRRYHGAFEPLNGNTPGS
jgi:hypothetical protein